MLGQVSNNVATARAWLDKVTAPTYQRNAYENVVVDAYSAAGITKSSDIKDDASLAKAAQTLGVSTDGLMKAMGGKCPFGGGLQKPTAKQE
jgi:hypothetical protein